MASKKPMKKRVVRKAPAKKAAPKRAAPKRAAPKRAAPKKAGRKASPRTSDKGLSRKIFHPAPAEKVAPKKKLLPKKIKTDHKKAAAKKAAAKKPVKKVALRKAKRPPLKTKLKPKGKKTVARLAAVPQNPAALALAKTIAAAAHEKKALQVTVIAMGQKSSAVGYDYVVIATGDSDRQLLAISESVDETLKAQGKRAASVEASYDWVCVSYDDGVVAHFFTADRRGQVDIEGQWADCARVAV
jgi:ribosome silencing factor RsfS/YbeB/iojap